MENEMGKTISYEEIEAIGNSVAPPSADDINTICTYFGINGSSETKITHMNNLGVPISVVIDALNYGENKINAYGDDPKITDLDLGDNNGKYAIIVIGDCGKTTGINAAYPLNDFRPIRNNGKY